MDTVIRQKKKKKKIFFTQKFYADFVCSILMNIYNLLLHDKFLAQKFANEINANYSQPAG